MAFVERRNHFDRAQTLCRVVAWLSDASLGGRRPTSAIVDAPAPAQVVERILRRLMLRGLTRKVAGERLHGSIGLDIPQSAIVIGVLGYSQPADNHFWNVSVVPFQRATTILAGLWSPDYGNAVAFTQVKPSSACRLTEPSHRV
jgi:hypothetical protein